MGLRNFNLEYNPALEILCEVRILTGQAHNLRASMDEGVGWFETERKTKVILIYQHLEEVVDTTQEISSGQKTLCLILDPAHACMKPNRILNSLLNMELQLF